MLDRLTPDQRSDLLGLGAQRTYEPGACILAEGTPPTHVVVVLDGEVRVTAAGDDGDVVVASRSAGDVLGEMSVLGDEARSATAWAQDRVRARVIAAATYLEFLERHPRVLLAQVHDLVARLRQSTTTLVGRGRSVDQRVARHLADVVGSGGGTDVRTTQADLAHHVGATRESVSRALGRLRDEGVVRTHRGAIEVLDVDRLEAAGHP